MNWPSRITPFRPSRSDEIEPALPYSKLGSPRLTFNVGVSHVDAAVSVQIDELDPSLPGGIVRRIAERAGLGGWVMISKQDSAGPDIGERNLRVRDAESVTISVRVMDNELFGVQLCH